MTIKRKNSIIVIILFIAVIWLPLIFSDKTGGATSETEKRQLAKFPTFSLSRTFASGLQNWINDNAGFRTQMQILNADISNKVLGTSSSNNVVIGKNGWYYYTGDNNISIETGGYELSKETLERIKENQVSLQNALRKKGIEYVLVLTPSKVSVYPENLPGNYNVHSTIIDEVSDYLQKNTTIPVINLKPDLLNAKQGSLVYHKTDTHWNESGAYIGYSAIINKLNLLGFINSSPAKISSISSTYKGEFSAMMGDPNLIPAESIKSTQITNPNSSIIQNGDLYNKIGELNKANDINTPYFMYENTTQNKKALIYGDSFFGNWKIPQLFAENFSSMDFIWSDYISANIVDSVSPDILIMERTERYIYRLANIYDPKLLYDPIKNPSSEIISTNTPNSIKKGKSYNINITVKNTSNETWNEERAVRLCIFQDGQDLGYRVKIPSGLDIKPGESYAFTLYDFQAPPQKNTTYLEYQMLQEGIAYFGEKYGVNIIIN
jgi:hypothetical protein